MGQVETFRYGPAMKFLIPSEQFPPDHAEVETLLDLAFGGSRRTKTSYRLREGNTAADGLSLVTREDGFGITGSISFWPLIIGESQTPAILLGPLAIHPERQNQGLGKVLLHESLARSRAWGHKLIILIGDAPYYLKSGFQYVPRGQIDMPGPIDPKRLLYLDLVPGALVEAQGLALPPWRWHDIKRMR